jgi:hypothetical protein
MNEVVNFEKNGLKMRVVFQNELESFVLRERFEKTGLDAKGVVFTHPLCQRGYENHTPFGTDGVFLPIPLIPLILRSK